MKKTLLVLTLMIALIATCLVGCSFLPNDSGAGIENENASAAVAIFTLDVNPGVRVYVKADDTVIAVEATNEDGESVVVELDLEGENYEAVVEEIIDKMEEKGFINGDESSVLISVEKKVRDISEKLNEKIEKTFEKHGKKVAVIEQELDKLDEEMKKAISDIANKHHISEGKAYLIDKIREEFPELSEEDLANLNVDDLNMILEEVSEDIKCEFKKIDKPSHKDYIGREQALAVALESLEITEEDVTSSRVQVTNRERKMLYMVEFVYGELAYKIIVDAESGEILETESKEFVEFDAEGIIGDFCGKYNITPDDIKDFIKDHHFGGHGYGDIHGDNDAEESMDKPLSKGEILGGILAELEILEESLKETDVKIHETEIGTVYEVTVKSVSGDVYRFVVEAYSGMIIKAELNGTVIEIYTEE